MSWRSLLWTLSLVLVVPLSIWLPPARQAQGQPVAQAGLTFTVNPTTGAPGSAATLTITGPASQAFTETFIQGANTFPLSNSVFPASGVITSPITIPAGAITGTATIQVVSGGLTAQQTFTVVGGVGTDCTGVNTRCWSVLRVDGLPLLPPPPLEFIPPPPPPLLPPPPPAPLASYASGTIENTNIAVGTITGAVLDQVLDQLALIAGTQFPGFIDPLLVPPPPAPWPQFIPPPPPGLLTPPIGLPGQPIGVVKTVGRGSFVVSGLIFGLPEGAAVFLSIPVVNTAGTAWGRGAWCVASRTSPGRRPCGPDRRNRHLPAAWRGHPGADVRYPAAAAAAAAPAAVSGAATSRA